MDCSTPGLPVHHQLPEFTQTHVHRVGGHQMVGDPTISSSVIPFSSHLQSFSASGSFKMSQLFTSGGQSIGGSASALVPPINIQDWFPLGWTGWMSLQSKGLSRVFSNTTVQKHQFFGFLYSPTFTSVQLYSLAFFIVQLSHLYMTTGKSIALTRWTFLSNVMSLLFNMLSRLVITFLPRSKRLLISRLQSPSAVILEKTLESPLDCKEIKPVNLKGNQS